jgi:Delta3-Delta2-enoyl-CoA isomerase
VKRCHAPRIASLDNRRRRSTGEREEHQLSPGPDDQAAPALAREGDVFLLHLGNAENRFNEGFVDAVEGHLDEVQAAGAPRALVTTAAGKIWSNGLDLEWMASHPEQIQGFAHRVHVLLARFLELNVPTVAALQGHTFAAGAMLALAHDQRVMRADRGYFCLPEAAINIPFTPGMSALIAARLSPQVAHEAMTTARRYGGDDAAAAGIVEEAVGVDDVLDRAIARAAALASKDPVTLGVIKQRLYSGALAALREQDSGLGPLG